MQRGKCLLGVLISILFGYIFVILLRNSSLSRHPYVKIMQGKLSETLNSVGLVSRKAGPEVVSRKVVLNAAEKASIKTCLETKEKELRQANGAFWKGDTRNVRFSSHAYLTNQSIVIDIGGNHGADAEEFMKRFGARLVIFEPLQPFYLKLKQKFAGNSKVKILDIGLGKKDKDTVMEIQGKDGEASSLYTGAAPPKGERVKIKNATRVLEEIGLGAFSIDLLHMDCEGCELDVLEALAHTNIIYNLKHIQFSTHTKYAGVLELVPRYCKMLEILKQTHKPMYQYKYVWESWALKDL